MASNMTMNIQELIAFCFDSQLFLFHLSMLVFMVSKIYQKHPHFEGGFYHIFTFLSIISSLGYIHSFFALRASNMFGWFVNFYLNTPIMARINPGISSYLIFINYTTTAFFAFNRFTAIAMPSKHSKIWKGRNLKFMIFLMVFIPTIWWSSVQWMNATAHYVITNGQLTYLYDFADVQMAFRIRAASICLISTIITLIFNIYTFILYKKVFRTVLIGRQRKSHFLEIKLLVVSTCTLIFQIFMCIYYALNLIGSSSIPRNTALISFAAIQWTWISNLLTVGNSVTLFLCSNVVRKYYLNFYGLKCCIKHVVNDVTISIKVTSPSLTNVVQNYNDEKRIGKYAKEISPHPIM